MKHKLLIVILSVSIVPGNTFGAAGRGLSTHERYAGDLNEQLRTALKYGTVAEAQALLEQGADVEGADAGGMTNLMRMAERGNIEKMRLLLDYGANVNAQEVGRSSYKRTPLIYAAWGRSAQLAYEAVSLLLEKRADPAVVGSDGLTAGDIARLRLSSADGSDKAWLNLIILILGGDLPGEASAGSAVAWSAPENAVDLGKQYILENEQIIQDITSRSEKSELAKMVYSLIQEMRSMNRMKEDDELRAAYIQQRLQKIIKKFGAQ